MNCYNNNKLMFGSYLIPNLYELFLKELKLPKSIQNEALIFIKQPQFITTKLKFKKKTLHTLLPLFPSYYSSEDKTIIELITHLLQINNKLPRNIITEIYEFLRKVIIWSKSISNYLFIILNFALLRITNMLSDYENESYRRAIKENNYFVIQNLLRNRFLFLTDKELLNLKQFILDIVVIDEKQHIFLYFKDTRRRLILRKIKTYLHCLNSFNNLYFITLEKRYSPLGNGFVEAQKEFNTYLSL